MAQHVNLFATLRRRRVSLFSRAGSVLVIAAVAGAVTALHRLDAQRVESLRTELGRNGSEAERLQRLLAQVPSPSAGQTERLAREEQEVAALETLVARLSANETGRAAGFTSHLRAFGRTTTDGVWLTAIRLEAGGGALALEGRALDAARVPAYIQGLRREPLLAGTTLAAIDLKSSEHEASDGVSFRLVAAEQRGAQHGGNTRPASPAAARGNLP